MNIYPITPVPKPWMTQRDKWAKRPAVMRYRAFADEVIMHGVKISESGSHVTFVMPMPKSWSGKKRQALDGQPHQSRPDVDNLCKALLDALYDEDSHIHDIRISKVWGVDGDIRICNRED